MSERVWSYNNTPHSTTGATPFALLRGRHSSNELSLAWVVSNSRVDDQTPRSDHVRQRVELSQAKSKVRYDDAKRVREEDFVVGECVRIRGPFKKACSKFYPETKIVQVDKHAMKVVDGKWWSKRRVAKIKGGNLKEIESCQGVDFIDEGESREKSFFDVGLFTEESETE